MADAEKRKAKQNHRQVAPAHEFENYKHATEDAHRTAEQFKWKKESALSVLTTLFSFGAVVFAGLAFYETKRQADIAQKAMISATRAWIEVVPVPPRCSLTWANEGSVTANVTGVNKGNSPASKVSFFAVTHINWTGDTSGNEEVTRLSCHLIEGHGGMLFVNESGDPVANLVHLNPAEYISYKYKTDLINLQLVRGYPVPITLTVCASYAVGGDDKVHHTGRTYDIGTGQGDGFKKPQIGIDIPAGSMTLIAQPESDYVD